MREREKKKRKMKHSFFFFQNETATRSLSQNVSTLLSSLFQKTKQNKPHRHHSAQAILRDHPQAYGATADALDGGLDSRDSWVEHLSWSPRASLHHAFLSRQECDHLIALATPHMEPSTVVDNVSGERQPSKVRTSSGMFLQRGADDVVRRIEDKIAAATSIPASHGEGLQVLLYESGERYEPHFDYFHEQVNQANGGQR